MNSNTMPQSNSYVCVGGLYSHTYAVPFRALEDVRADITLPQIPPFLSSPGTGAHTGRDIQIVLRETARPAAGRRASYYRVTLCRTPYLPGIRLLL